MWTWQGLSQLRGGGGGDGCDLVEVLTTTSTKLQRLMGVVRVKASSTKGRDLASPEPSLGREL